MTVDLAERAGKLIDQILTRFHESHRCELPGLLIEDLQAEHVGHGETMQTLRTRLDGLSVPPGAAARLASLRGAFDKLAADLDEHVRTEDEILFPLFAPNGSCR